MNQTSGRRARTYASAREDNREYRNRREPSENPLPFTLVKWGLIVLLFVYIGMILKDQTTKDVSPAELRQALLPEAEAAELKEADLSTFRKKLGFQPGSLEWVYFTSGSLMNVQEILMVKSDDSSLLDEAASAVNARLASQKEAFEGYGTNQTDLLQHAVVLQKGEYLFYAVSEQVEQCEAAFLSCIR